jgi:penicillin amidase
VLNNASSEASRATFIRNHGEDALHFREFFQPAHELEIPDGLDLSAIPDDVLEVYELARSSVSFDRNADGEFVLAVSETPDSGSPSGSNNWVIAPSRSATGRPILANDPHRAITLPSLRYIAHLSAPGLDVIGAGEPAIPGISIGHNGRVAFGLTIFYIDQEDLYVYTTRPEKPDAYGYRDDWHPWKSSPSAFPCAVHRQSR